MKRIDLAKIEGASFGENSFIECDEFINEGGFQIGDNVEILARRVYLGNNARLGDNTKIRALAGEMESFYMGDESLIDYNSQVMVPEFSIGDYSRIFNSSLCSGYKSLIVGHNCWVGQSSILNSAETLTIGNNVRMGSVQIWTHVASGELLEGCRFYSVKPVTIEDNVWLMGFGHTISPGVTIKKNTIVMSGSVVSKSTEAFHTYSGVPAEDITNKLNGWDVLSQKEKFEMLENFVKEFSQNYPEYKNRVLCLDKDKAAVSNRFSKMLEHSEPSLIFLTEVQDWRNFAESPHSIFDILMKTYLKRRTKIEVDWMNFSIGYRARFIPLIVDDN